MFLASWSSVTLKAIEFKFGMADYIDPKLVIIGKGRREAGMN